MPKSTAKLAWATLGHVVWMRCRCAMRPGVVCMMIDLGIEWNTYMYRSKVRGVGAIGFFIAPNVLLTSRRNSRMYKRSPTLHEIHVLLPEYPPAVPTQAVQNSAPYRQTYTSITYAYHKNPNSEKQK